MTSLAMNLDAYYMNGMSGSHIFKYFSYRRCVAKLTEGPAPEEFSDLKILQPIKFVQAFFLLITLTATLLNVVSAQNPWSLNP